MLGVEVQLTLVAWKQLGPNQQTSEDFRSSDSLVDPNRRSLNQPLGGLHPRPSRHSRDETLLKPDTGRQVLQEQTPFDWLPFCLLGFWANLALVGGWVRVPSSSHLTCSTNSSTSCYRCPSSSKALPRLEELALSRPWARLNGNGVPASLLARTGHIDVCVACPCLRASSEFPWYNLYLYLYMSNMIPYVHMTLHSPFVILWWVTQGSGMPCARTSAHLKRKP